MAGILVTLTAPSGVGKSVVVKDIFTRYADRYGEAVSTTTRAPRAGEVDGVAYHFVSPDEFTSRWSTGRFLERVEYNGKEYGIEKWSIQKVLDQGKNVLLVVEPNGATQIRERWKGPLLQLFLKAPNDEILVDRLVGRGDSPVSIARRLENDPKLFKEHEFPYDAIFTNRVISATADAIVQYVFASFEIPLH